MTHPHLEGLIREWRDDAEDASKTAAKFPPGPVRQQGEWWAAARIRSADELEAALALPDDLEECRRHSCKRKAALAALPGGGVDAKDAARYRWLRDRHDRTHQDWHVRDPFNNAPDIGRLDAAIDAAMKDTP